MDEVKILFWMTNAEGDRKPVVRDGVQALLEAEGWTVEENAKPAKKKAE